jgi:TolB-like protein/Flp pilus assembly protein TadD
LSDGRVDRRLAAILAADVAGYSRLMGRDEEGTLERLKAHRRELIDPKIKAHGGRIVKTTGDGLLVEFASPVEAVRCAVELQQSMIGREADLPEGQRFRFRVGINLGDVIVEGDGDLYGDGVNIAARLEQLAEPGGVLISGSVHDHVRNRLPLVFQDLGEQRVKNIAEPVRVYQVGVDRQPADRQTAPKLSLPDKPSIAALPFTNMSGDPEQEYFADGVVEDIITALSRVRWLFVIARNSSFTYKGRAVDIKQVGRELGVRYVLEGSIRKAGNRVRITGQLIDGMTGAHLWADRFDGLLEDIFDLQDQITQSVVGAIEPQLRLAETERARRKPTENLDAYDCFLRAMPLVFGMTQEGNAEALALLRRAIDLDPTYSSAYGLAAQCFVFRRTMNWATSFDEEAQEGARLARLAVEFGSDDPTALWMAGQALAYLAYDYDAALAAVDRSLALNPSSASAYCYSGWVRVYCGDNDTALDHFARGLRLSPHDPMEWLFYAGMGYAYLQARRYEEAIAAARRALHSNSKWAGIYRVLAASYAHLGRADEARTAVERLLAIDPGLTVAKFKNFLNATDTSSSEPMYEGLRKAGLPEE